MYNFYKEIMQRKSFVNLAKLWTKLLPRMSTWLRINRNFTIESLKGSKWVVDKIY